MNLSRAVSWALPLGLVACGSAGGATSAPDGGALEAAPRSDGKVVPDSGHARDGSHSDGGGTSADSGRPTPDALSGDAPKAPPTQTVSSWMGTNVNADLPFVDVTRLMTPFDTAAAQKDANGYPVAGASGKSHTDLGFLLPSGTYNISFVGTGSVTVSGIGVLGGTWQTVAGEQRNTVTITGTPQAFGNFLDLTVTNTGTATVKSLHLYLPGIDYDAAKPFNPAFLAALGPFRAMRFMEWEAINGSKLTDWTSRPVDGQFGTSAYGQPYELIAELINETGKDGWINVPELASTDFITQFATFMASKLDFTRIAAARQAAGLQAPFQLIVENSNETWNMGFTAYATFLAAANANPSRYPGTYAGTYGPSWMSGNASLMKVGQYEADRLVAIGNAFKAAFMAGGHSGAIAPVLSGWALGAVYSDEGLQFIKVNYGDPKTYVSYVALAPYFATADDTTTGSLATLFPALSTNITSMDMAFQGFEQLGTQYGVSIAAYEGGQGIGGATNEPIKHLAQFDQRMYAAYTQYFDFWTQHFGKSLFMHFDLAGDPGIPENIYQYGFWGSLPGLEEDLSTCGTGLPTLAGTEAVASVMKYCPKYKALTDRVPE